MLRSVLILYYKLMNKPVYSYKSGVFVASTHAGCQYRTRVTAMQSNPTSHAKNDRPLGRSFRLLLPGGKTRHSGKLQALDKRRAVVAAGA